MNKAIFIFFLPIILFSCSSDNGGTDPTPTGTDISPIISKFNSNITISQDGDFYVIESDGLPNHGSPYWPVANPLYEAYNGTNPNWNQNPNTIASQNFTFRIPRYVTSDSSPDATSLGAIGIAVNGVAIFNQYAGPNNAPLTNEINSFDQNAGHPQNSGIYHYHIEPLALTSMLGQDAFIGLLLDGYPVYGPLENGITVTSADLDVYHGHAHATADFPSGIYHYHITADDPYINGNGYYGNPGSVTN